MKENDWLSNEGCSNAAEAFLAILHKNQVSNFLLWADHNAEAIDELDSVNASYDVPAGPVFGFGVESMPMECWGKIRIHDKEQGHTAAAATTTRGTRRTVLTDGPGARIHA
jgi:hypothetical protein